MSKELKIRGEIMRKVIFCLACALFASACAKDMNSSTYVSSSPSGKVIMGKVLSVRQVTIKENASAKENVLGTASGAVAGGVAGSTIGKGDGNDLAILGGALAGAVIGNMAESYLSQSEGMEYIVKISPEYVDDYEEEYVEKTELSINTKGDSVSKELRDKAKTPSSKTHIISVVQGMDDPIAVGSEVYIIYSDDRPRIIAAN